MLTAPPNPPVPPETIATRFSRLTRLPPLDVRGLNAEVFLNGHADLFLKAVRERRNNAAGFVTSHPLDAMHGVEDLGQTHGRLFLRHNLAEEVIKRAQVHAADGNPGGI